LEIRWQGVKVFLDSSVILSACGSERSLSRLITILAAERGWSLISAAYCRAETVKNLAKFAPQATAVWQDLQARIEWVPNALTTKRPLLLTASKDKPVLISALAAKCDTLLTLDTGDFGILLGTEVYGMRVATPRDFLIREGLGVKG
jgi:predicted nucleic acid-binding protein